MSLIYTDISKNDYNSFFNFLVNSALIYYIENFNCYDKLIEVYNRRIVFDLDEDSFMIETPELDFLGINGYEILLDYVDNKLIITGHAVVSTKFVDYLVELSTNKNFKLLFKYNSMKDKLNYKCDITSSVVKSIENRSGTFNYLLLQKLSYRSLDFTDKDVNILFTKYGLTGYNANVYIVKDMSTGEEIELEKTMMNPYLFNYLFYDLNICLNDKLSVFQYSDGVDLSVLKGILDFDMGNKLEFYINFRTIDSSMTMMNTWDSLFKLLGEDYYSDTIEIKMIFDSELNELDDYVKCVVKSFRKYFKNISLYNHYMSY